MRRWSSREDAEAGRGAHPASYYLLLREDIHTCVSEKGSAVADMMGRVCGTYVSALSTVGSGSNEVRAPPHG